MFYVNSIEIGTDGTSAAEFIQAWAKADESIRLLVR